METAKNGCNGSGDHTDHSLAWLVVLHLLPMVYIVWWKRNIFLGMIVHCTGNLIGAVLMISMISTGP
jgi:hypothetical protein